MQAYSDRIELLSDLVGAPLAWLYGSRFVIDGDLVVAPYLAIELDTSFLVLRSEHEETPTNQDYFRFVLERSRYVDAQAIEKPITLDNVSTIVVDPLFRVAGVTLWSTEFEDDDHGMLSFDSWITVDSADGRRISLGHSPMYWDSICFRIGNVLPPEPELESQLKVRLVWPSSQPTD